MNKLSQISLLALTIGLTTTAVQADTILGVKAGAGSWNTDTTGVIGNSTSSLSQLGYSDEQQNFFYASLEHPIPFVPNIRLQKTDLTSSGNSSGNIDLGGVSLSGTIASELDLSHTDAVLYYEILDNWVSLDLGINFRKFDASMKASNGVTSTSGSVDEVVPMLYGMAQFDLPFTGLSVGGDANLISVGDNKVSDYSANLRYTSGFILDLGVELGYRAMSIKFEDSSDFNTDIEVKGPYLSAQLQF